MSATEIEYREFTKGPNSNVSKICLLEKKSFNEYYAENASKLNLFLKLK